MLREWGTTSVIHLNIKINIGRPPWMYKIIKVQQKSDAPDFIRTRFYFKDLFYKDIYKCSEGSIGVRRGLPPYMADGDAYEHKYIRTYIGTSQGRITISRGGEKELFSSSRNVCVCVYQSQIQISDRPWHAGNWWLVMTDLSIIYRNIQTSK